MEWNGTWHNNEKVKQETTIVFDLRKMWYHNSKRGVKNYSNKFTFSFCINFLRGAFKFRDCQLVAGSLLPTLEHDLVAKGHLIISTSLANSITQNKLREYNKNTIYYSKIDEFSFILVDIENIRTYQTTGTLITWRSMWFFRWLCCWLLRDE